MPFPVAVVEIGFDHGPYTLSPTWTDVTSYVRSMNVDRGRTDDYSSISGSAQIVLNNRDRRFDPFNTSGPYYGKLLPRRQIRIRATYGATTYDVFRGFISGFQPNFTDAGKDSTTTIDCFDALQLLSSSQLPADWANVYVRSLSPRNYYPLDEPIIQFVSTNVGRDLGSVPTPFTFTSSAYNDSQLAIGLADSSVAGDDSDFATTGALVSRANTTFGNFAFSCWCKLPDTTSAITLNGINGGMNVIVNITNYASSTAQVVVTVGQNINDYVVYSSVSGLDLSLPFHLAFSWNEGTKTGTMFINGVDRTGTRVTNPAGLFVSWDYRVAFTAGTFQQLVVWFTTITSTQVQNIVRFSTANFDETTSARVSRIIAQTPFSTSLVSTPASPAGRCLAITDGAPYVTNELQLVADTECAPMFVSRNGTLTLMQRDALFNDASSFTSQATFGTGGQSLDPNIAISFDGDNLRNEVTVSGSGGATYTADKVASQTANGLAASSVDTQASTYADVAFIAERLAGIGQEARMSLSPLRVVISPTGDWSTVLARELFHRVTVVFTPDGGSQIAEDVLIRRITHSVTAGQWDTTLEGSGRLAGYFRADYSFADSSDVVIYS